MHCEILGKQHDLASIKHTAPSHIEIAKYSLYP
jgi:hypothetical protein